MGSNGELKFSIPDKATRLMLYKTLGKDNSKIPRICVEVAAVVGEFWDSITDHSRKISGIEILKTQAETAQKKLIKAQNDLKKYRDASQKLQAPENLKKPGSPNAKSKQTLANEIVEDLRKNYPDFSQSGVDKNGNVDINSVIDNLNRLMGGLEKGWYDKTEKLYKWQADPVRSEKYFNQEIEQARLDWYQAELPNMFRYYSKLEIVYNNLNGTLLKELEKIKVSIKKENKPSTTPKDNTKDLPEDVLGSFGNVVDALERVAGALQGCTIVKPQEAVTTSTNNISTDVNGNPITGQSTDGNPPQDSGNTGDGKQNNGADSTIQAAGNWSVVMENMASQTAQSMQSTMSSFFFDAINGQLKSLSDYANSFLNSISQAISDKMMDMFTDFIMKGLGFAAEGGPVTGGSTYIVGEQGPEIFVPSSGGTIIPNHQLNSIGAASREVMVNVINKTGRPVDAKQISRFDGQKYIVDVQLDPLNRNTGGMGSAAYAG
jgi:hypothetical protein